MSFVQAKTQSKLIHYNYNLDYPIQGYNIEEQTNHLINIKINDIINKYSKSKKKYFILEYKDDLISVIAFKMLNAISSISNFDFYIYGKIKKTKKLLQSINPNKKVFKTYKAYKTISLKKLRLLSKNETVYFSIYNPIYNVIPNTEFYNNLGVSLGLEVFYLVKEFTPQEFFTARDFYGINYISNEIDESSSAIKSYQKWIDLPGRCIVPPALQAEICYPEYINVVYLNNDWKEDSEILNNVEQSDYLTFYFYKDKPDILKDVSNIIYSTYVKNKSNIPRVQYLNINCNDIVEYLIKKGVKVKVYGKKEDFYN